MRSDEDNATEAAIYFAIRQEDLIGGETEMDAGHKSILYMKRKKKETRKQKRKKNGGKNLENRKVNNGHSLAREKNKASVQTKERKKKSSLVFSSRWVFASSKRRRPIFSIYGHIRSCQHESFILGLSETPFQLILDVGIVDFYGR